MAEQNFSAALSTWKGELVCVLQQAKLIGRDQSFRAAKVPGLDGFRAGREPKGEHGWSKETSRTD